MKPPPCEPFAPPPATHGGLVRDYFLGPHPGASCAGALRFLGTAAEPGAGAAVGLRPESYSVCSACGEVLAASRERLHHYQPSSGRGSRGGTG